MGKKRILVVDDDRDARDMVRYILEAEGFEIIEATDGQMAVESAQSSRPDLIVMDMMMPKKDGFVATMDIRRDASLGDVPIVVLTGIDDHVRGEAAAKNVRSGLAADAFLQKPIEPEELLKAVRELLTGSEEEE